MHDAEVRPPCENINSGEAPYHSVLIVYCVNERHIVISAAPFHSVQLHICQV